MVCVCVYIYEFVTIGTIPSGKGLVNTGFTIDLKITYVNGKQTSDKEYVNRLYAQT